MTIATLNTIKIITSVVAPILTFGLAILNGYSDKKKEKKIKKGHQVIVKKSLSLYGKVIIALLLLTSILTLSGIKIDQMISERTKLIQDSLDNVNKNKRDSILHVAVLTLDSVSAALRTTQDIQRSSQRLARQLHKVDSIEGKNLAVTQDITFSVDVLDSARLRGGFTLADSDDYSHLHVRYASRLDELAESRLNQSDLTLFLLGPTGSRDKAVFEAIHSSWEPELFDQNPSIFGTLFVKRKDDTVKMYDIAKQTIGSTAAPAIWFHWKSTCKYVQGNTRLSFSTLNNTYAIICLKSPPGYLGITVLFLTNAHKTRVYMMFPTLVKRYISKDRAFISLFVTKLEQNDWQSGNF